MKIQKNTMKHPAAVICVFLLLHAFPVSATLILKTISTGNDTTVSPETPSPQHLSYDGLSSIVLGVAGLLVSALALMLGLKYGRLVTLVPGAMYLSPNATIPPANTFDTSLTDITPLNDIDNVSAASHQLQRILIDGGGESIDGTDLSIS